MIDFFRNKEDENITKEYIIIGLGAALGILVMVIGALTISRFTQIGGIFIIMGLTISVLPFGIISFLKGRAIRNMETNFPNFLNDLAESKRGGMTILGSFESADETDYGRLNREVEKIYNQLSWGIPFPKTMEKFADRVQDSAVLTQMTMIIVQSYRSGGNITDTIQSVADNASMLRSVVEEKNSTMRQQLIIMYIIYLLFIGITIGVYLLLEQLLGLGTEGGGLLSNLSSVLGDGASSSINYCSGQIPASEPFCTTAEIFGFVPSDISSLGSQRAERFKYGQMAYYKSLLFSMLMVQAVSTSAIAGKMSDGRASAGLKHGLVLIPIAFIAFMVIIRPMGY